MISTHKAENDNAEVDGQIVVITKDGYRHIGSPSKHSLDDIRRLVTHVFEKGAVELRIAKGTVWIPAGSIMTVSWLPFEDGQEMVVDFKTGTQ